MAFWNKIVRVRHEWEWPDEDIQRIEVNGLTDAQGSIIINYDNIDSLDILTSIHEVTLPFVPATQYTIISGELNNSDQFSVTSRRRLNTGKYLIQWQLETIEIAGVVDGKNYIVSININNVIEIEFLVKVVNVEVL